MKRLPTSILALCLFALFAICFYVLPQTNKAATVIPTTDGLNSTVAYEYEVSLAANEATTKSNSIRLSYDATTQKLLVAVFENGDAAGYVAENVSNPIGTFTMQQRKVFNDNVGLYAPVNSITLEVVSINTTEVKFVITYNANSQSKYTAPKVEEITPQLRPGVCSNPSGTGACDQVNTNSDWWRCFRCCFIGGGCGA